MIQITKQEAEKLRDKGLGKYIHITSRTHGARAKRYYVTETSAVKKVLKK